MVKIKKIGVLSAGKVVGILYAVFGIIGALFLALFSMAGAVFSGSKAALFSGVFSLAFLLIIPIFYGVMGFIFACLAALVYNQIAGKIGGLEIETE